MMNTTTTDGRGIDSTADKRPGVPAERTPAPVGNAHWLAPEHQTPSSELTIDAQRGAPTATFGSGQPPRGISGIMRRAAYRMPDYEARRWLLLMMADRVDTVEDRVIRFSRSPITWAVLAAGAGLYLASRREARRPLLARIFG